MKRSGKLYRHIAEWDNLLIAFYNAARGKRLRPDVVLYEKNLYENLKTLQTHLINQTVPIGNYRFFKIYDPKERLICAAPFEERVLMPLSISLDWCLSGFKYTTVTPAGKGRGQTPRYCVRCILPNSILISSSLI